MVGAPRGLPPRNAAEAGPRRRQIGTFPGRRRSRSECRCTPLAAPSSSVARTITSASQRDAPGLLGRGRRCRDQLSVRRRSARPPTERPPTAPRATGRRRTGRRRGRRVAGDGATAQGGGEGECKQDSLDHGVGFLRFAKGARGPAPRVAGDDHGGVTVATATQRTPVTPSDRPLQASRIPPPARSRPASHVQ